MRDDRQQNLDKLQLSLYLMPFVGALWAAVKLLSSQSNLETQELKTIRLSVRIALIWLVSYGTLWLGGSFTPELWAVKLLYLNGIVTTTYLVSCFVLINRIWSQNLNKHR